MKLSFLLFSVHLARAPVAGTSVVTPTPCKDDPEFRFKQERDKTCEWVAEKPIERCEKEWKRIDLSYYCPRACDLCGPSPAPSTPPSGSPSSPPTGAPSTPPSAAPTGCDPELCFNNPDFKLKNCGKFDCKWVAKKTESRCYKEDNNKGLTALGECPESCAASDFCLDVASKDGLEGCDGDKKYLCPITCGLCDLCPETSSRVSLRPFQVSRGGCPAPVVTPQYVLCDWTGVGCTSTSETRLELGGSSVQGTIPSEIGELTALTYLALGGSSVQGSIPSEIGELTALTTLSLWNNDLAGNIPLEIAELTGLTYLDLGLNTFTGSIPSQLGELTGLNVLYLDINDFSGSIPSEMGQLTGLTTLFLNDNNLTGSIPAEMASLTSLVNCDLTGNSFTNTDTVPIACSF